MKKVSFHNLGCKVNAYELELMQQNFKKSGYEIVPFGKKTDICIINTCTVTNIADRKSRQMLHKAKKENPDALIVAIGCYVETDKDRALEDEAIDLAIGNKEKSLVVEKVEAYLNGNACTPPCATDTILRELFEHTRAYIKIQDGCNQFCSYCIIPYSRGRIETRNEKEIISEIEALAEGGCKEFVLTGIHLSSYGVDLINTENGGNVSGDDRVLSYNEIADKGSFVNYALIDIIKRVANIKGVERVRLGSLEPRIITDEFLKEMSMLRVFCPHFHLSLQSGSDSVLKRMNRHYTAQEFKEKVELIRKYFEHPAITTDVIVGFPGETEEEFMETREFLTEADFYEVHVFKYSRRQGTLADKLKVQLTEKEKAARSKLLIEDSDERKRRFVNWYKGREVEILVEEKASKSDDNLPFLKNITENQNQCANNCIQVGYNKEYVKFALISEQDLTGELFTGIVME